MDDLTVGFGVGAEKCCFRANLKECKAAVRLRRRLRTQSRMLLEKSKGSLEMASKLSRVRIWQRRSRSKRGERLEQKAIEVIGSGDVGNPD